ncbi:hypothetical protein QR680_012601 [Steinernema hermaphroditum]|uniref:Putative nuclease HARBI1 n=1 Tax=Steinernema hermaphroditum TaxID=289476 RepID=A0AA39I2I4_9BILA|nr:hypothetical protein QR680_012601 [Steinernema hermaphroditum]
MASFIASQRGGEKLLYAGYIYSKHRTKDDKISWRCERFPKPNFCRGRAESVKGNVIETQEHNHQPCPQKCEAAKIASRIKETASTSTETSHAAAGLQVSQPTVSRCLERVVDAIIKKMNLFVKWPSENEARHISQRFFQTTGIPNIIGAIDGTHCRIQAPVDREYEYVNRKQFHSINCMVIAIPNLIAIGFSAKYPGRSHDSRIFKDSVIYEDFVHRRKKGVLLGDSAYGAERFLLKPILRPASDAERRYTEAIAYPVEVKFKSRSCVADLTETFKCCEALENRTISSIEISAFFYSTVLPEAPFPEPSFSRKGILWLFPSLRSITALSLPGIGDLHRPSSPDQ